MHVVSCDVRLTTSIPSRLVKIVSMDLFEMQYLYAAWLMSLYDVIATHSTSLKLPIRIEVTFL